MHLFARYFFFITVIPTRIIMYIGCFWQALVVSRNYFLTTPTTNACMGKLALNAVNNVSHFYSFVYSVFVVKIRRISVLYNWNLLCNLRRELQQLWKKRYRIITHLFRENYFYHSTVSVPNIKFHSRL